MGGLRNSERRVDSRQSARARSAREFQQNGFSLIIQRVGGGNLVELVFSQQPSEEIVSKFPRRRLKALFAFRRMCLHIAAVGQELQVITGGQSAHKLLVGFRLCTPELVIEMNNGEDDAQILPEFEQKAQQGSGIRSAGDGHPDAV